MTISVLLVAPLDEPISATARNPAVQHAGEVIAALSTGARLHQGLALTVVAARGSMVDVPMISVDPHQLGETSEGVRALLLQAMAMTGEWDEYDLVHCLAPAAGATQLHAARGGALFYTPATSDDPALLSALRRIGRVETGDPALPAAIEQGLHPVDPTRFTFAPPPRTRLARATGTWQPESSHCWTELQSMAEIAGSDAAIILGPQGASRFEHLCWATRSLMSGAVYVHDHDDLGPASWPIEGVRSIEEGIDAIATSVRLAEDLPERLRRWALAYCAPAATAAGLRRRYARIAAPA